MTTLRGGPLLARARGGSLVPPSPTAGSAPSSGPRPAGHLVLDGFEQADVRRNRLLRHSHRPRDPVERGRRLPRNLTGHLRGGMAGRHPEPLEGSIRGVLAVEPQAAVRADLP